MEKARAQEWPETRNGPSLMRLSTFVPDQDFPGLMTLFFFFFFLAGLFALVLLNLPGDHQPINIWVVGPALRLVQRWENVSQLRYCSQSNVAC